MMLIFAVICSMSLSLNAQEVTEKLESALNDPQDLTEQAKNAEGEAIADAEVDTEKVSNENSSSWFGWLWPFGGDDEDEVIVADDKTEPIVEELEIEEINTEKASKEKEEKAELKGDAANEINSKVSEEIAEDEAIADAEVDTEKVSNENTSSWFGWLWPFGGDDEDEVVVEGDITEPTVEKLETEEIVETISETPTTETITEELAEAEETDEPEMVSEIPEAEGKINVTNKLIYYFPNLFLNLMDSFTANIGLGAKSTFALSMTRYAQFGGSYGDEVFLEKGIYRRYGGGYNNGHSLKLGPLLGEKRYIDNVIGDMTPRIIKKPELQMQRPTNAIYKDKYRNFWTVGIDIGWLINIGLHLEPIEFADFITGIFFYDLCDDDLGRSVEGDATEEDIDENVEELETIEGDL